MMQGGRLLKDSEGQTLSLYGLRHTYATLVLTMKRNDVNSPVKQIGNSMPIIERCYSKLTAMAVDRFN